MNRIDLNEFSEGFGNYREPDARTHIEFLPAPNQATLVDDQHDATFNYRPIEDYTRILVAIELSEGRALKLSIPQYHRNHLAYQQGVRDLTFRPASIYSPLRKGVEW